LAGPQFIRRRQVNSLEIVEHRSLAAPGRAGKNDMLQWDSIPDAEYAIEFEFPTEESTRMRNWGATDKRRGLSDRSTLIGSQDIALSGHTLNQRVIPNERG
jgi:hypothetical protein